jgi:hypothetical protein
MTTGKRLVYQALRDLGVIRAGQTASPESYTDGLDNLNQIVDSWNTERLTVLAIERNVEDLTAGVTAYVFDPRPTRLTRAGYIPAGSSEETPLEVLTVERWADGRPGVYNDTAAPVATFHVRPEPEAGDQIALYTWSQLPAFDADTETTLAPGYEIALRFALAATLAPSFEAHIKIASPHIDSIEAKARKYKASIKSLNMRPLYLRVDSALLV